MCICFIMCFCCAFPEMILKAAAATLNAITVNEGLPAIQ